ncbi:MAG: rhodanese-like domain-containing protein [Pseudolabrys sp.]
MKGYLPVVKDSKGAMILDVRESAEFAAGHIPGAVNIPRGVLEFKIYKELGYPKKVGASREIYVQRQTGGRASFAAARPEEDRLQEPDRRGRQHGRLGEGGPSVGKARSQVGTHET